MRRSKRSKKKILIVLALLLLPAGLAGLLVWLGRSPRPVVAERPSSQRVHEHAFQPLFVARLDFPLASDGEWLAIEDLNGDGLSDLLIPTNSGRTLDLLVRKPGGAFHPARHIELGGLPVAVAVGRFDADAQPDLAVTDMQDGTLAVYLGQEDGSYQAGQRFQVFTETRSADDNQLSTFQGTRTFYDLDTVHAVDLDQDGCLDLVMTRAVFPWMRPRPTGQTLAVCMGSCDGRFSAPVEHATGGDPVAVAIGQLDGDGVPDMAVANYVGGDVVVMHGTGDGGLRMGARSKLGGNIADVELADFDGDGALDLAAADRSRNQVHILRGTGQGAFSLVERQDAGSVPDYIFAMDLHQDGKPDLLTADGGSPATTTVLRGLGGCRFQLVGKLPAGHCVNAVGSLDVDGDGFLEVATANSASRNASLYLNDGRGGLLSAPEYDIGTMSLSMVMADLDGDQDRDLVAAGLTDGSLHLLLNDGQGRFGAPLQRKLGRSLRAVIAADFDGDGRADLAAADSAQRTLTVLPGMAPQGEVLWQSGQIDAHDLAWGRLEPNGSPDLAYADRRRCAVGLLRGRGDGTFLAPSWADPQGCPWALAMGDVNGDGYGDVVATLPEKNAVGVLLGGAQGLAHAAGVGAGDSPVAVALADFDGDGHADLATANFGSSTISVFRGRGDGGFDLLEERPAARDPVDLAVADADGDGQLDLVAANYHGNNITVLLGDGQGRFPERHDYGAGYEPGCLAVGDLDGDGMPDVATANASFDENWMAAEQRTFRASNAVSVLKNCARTRAN